jgi:hypothetical protein
MTTRALPTTTMASVARRFMNRGLDGVTTMRGQRGAGRRSVSALTTGVVGAEAITQNSRLARRATATTTRATTSSSSSPGQQPSRSMSSDLGAMRPPPLAGGGLGGGGGGAYQQQQPPQQQQQQFGGGNGGGNYYASNTNGGSGTSSNSNNVFVDYGVYKTKGALKIKCVRPTFETDAGGRKIMKRAGGVLFELASSTAPRAYDWGNKGSFMLSGTEAAELADRMAANAPCSFFHDPGAGGANRGAVNKGFKTEPMPDGSGGLFVNLSTTSAGNKSFHSVPVSYGESAAIRHILVYLVPRVLGFDEVFLPQ